MRTSRGFFLLDDGLRLTYKFQVRNQSSSNTPISLIKHVRLRKKGALMLERITGDLKRINAELGHAFKLERVTRRLKAGTIAGLMGIDSAHLSSLECGRRSWTDELLQKAFQALENHGRR